MLKIVVVGATALFLAASPIAQAQTPSATPERLNAADRNTLMDLRIALAKAALQLTPDQEKYWPAVENAIRASGASIATTLPKFGGDLYVYGMIALGQGFLLSSMIFAARPRFISAAFAPASKSSCVNPSRFPFSVIWCWAVHEPEGL